MKLRVLNSGSDGNGYLLECGGDILILECGVSTKTAKLALDFDLSKVVGIYISHGHTDHSKYRREYEMLGIKMITPYDLDKIRINEKAGGFDLQAFRLPHGDIFSYGVLIRHSTGDTTLFMTDFEYCQYTFKGCKVNNYIVECNYQPEYIDLDAPNKEHKIMGHVSLPTCKRFLIANQNEYMKNVLLVHMGKDSANPKECVAEIQNVLGNGVKVDYARPNETYEFKGKEVLPWDI